MPFAVTSEEKQVDAGGVRRGRRRMDALVREAHSLRKDFTGSTANAALAGSVLASNDAIGVYSEESQPTVLMTCCDVWNSTYGNYGGYCTDPGSANGNMSADPQFCNPESWDYTLCNTSPCASAPCGLIGAFEVGCQCGVSVQPITWGAIKSMYR